jgi:hypothetical protein
MRNVVRLPIPKLNSIVCALLVSLIVIALLTTQSLPQALAASASRTFTSFQDFTICSVGPAPVSNGAGVIDEQGGEVSLSSTFADEFTGSTLLETRWQRGSYDGDNVGREPLPGDPAPIVASGAVTLKPTDNLGLNIQSRLAYNTTNRLEVTGLVRFSAGAFQHFGFAGPNFLPYQFAIFSTRETNNTIYARTNFSANTTDDFLTPIGSVAQLGDRARLFKIVWLTLPDSDEMRYYVDDQLVATHTLPPGKRMPESAMMITLSNDAKNDDATLRAERIALEQFAGPSGEYIGCATDSGKNGTSWKNVQLDVAAPSGTSIRAYIQASDNLETLESAPFVAIGATGAPTSAVTGRYARYKVEMTGTSSATPKLRSIILTFDTPPGSGPLPTSTPAGGGQAQDKRVFLPMTTR